VTRSARPGRSVDAGLRDEVLTAAGHLAERLDGLVDAAALDREPLSLGVKPGLEELVGGGHHHRHYRTNVRTSRNAVGGLVVACQSLSLTP
jgi:hypothetical protein